MDNPKHEYVSLRRQVMRWGLVAIALLVIVGLFFVGLLEKQPI